MTTMPVPRNSRQGETHVAASEPKRVSGIISSSSSNTNAMASYHTRIRNAKQQIHNTQLKTSRKNVFQSDDEDRRESLSRNSRLCAGDSHIEPLRPSPRPESRTMPDFRVGGVVLAYHGVCIYEAKVRCWSGISKLSPQSQTQFTRLPEGMGA